MSGAHSNQIVFPQYQQPPHNKMQVHTYTSRRTASSASISTTTSSGHTFLPLRNNSEDLRRSISSRSTGPIQPTSYVALMRKQKATVWCDRAQLEDPRLLAQQKAAKMQASREVVGGPVLPRASTSGSASLSGSTRVAAKIRHHGKPGLVGYTPTDQAGGVVGVPTRLSATEVEGGESNDDSEMPQTLDGSIHRRTGSGRSSISSSRKRLAYPRHSPSMLSTTNAPNLGKTLGDGKQSLGENFVAQEESDALYLSQPSYCHRTAMVRDNNRCASSGSIRGEKADCLPELSSLHAARLTSNSHLNTSMSRQKSTKSPEELRRRGSVDDRAMTMGTVRLYIANPDADSD
ncbi:unnamed protein product [Blumeria hordei]|uniref:Uncharacterized protein n=2 Tax=Blumeria hordei TaxID=2867405 RepID=A0A383UW32_BLUHO|nr:unnamed protein product [Blumeria hordei]